MKILFIVSEDFEGSGKEIFMLSPGPFSNTSFTTPDNPYYPNSNHVKINITPLMDNIKIGFLISLTFLLKSYTLAKC